MVEELMILFRMHDPVCKSGIGKNGKVSTSFSFIFHVVHLLESAFVIEHFTKAQEWMKKRTFSDFILGTFFTIHLATFSKYFLLFFQQKRIQLMRPDIVNCINGYLSNTNKERWSQNQTKT